MNKNVFNVKNLVTFSMLVAIQIILTRFLSVQAWNFRIGFGFVPIVFASMYLGMVPAVLIACVSDILGCFLFSPFPYMPGYTLSVGLTAVIYSLCLEKNRSQYRILLAILISQLLCSLVINSYLLTLSTGSPLLPLMQFRVLQVLINSILQYFAINAIVLMFEKRKIFHAIAN